MSDANISTQDMIAQLIKVRDGIEVIETLWADGIIAANGTIDLRCRITEDELSAALLCQPLRSMLDRLIGAYKTPKPTWKDVLKRFPKAPPQLVIKGGN